MNLSGEDKVALSDMRIKRPRQFLEDAREI
jgi:hypothetical protein